MAWLKIETHTPDKPEIYDIAQIVGVSPNEAFGACFRVWAWFDAHTTDGKTNGISVSEALIDNVSRVSGFADAMYQAGWLEDDGLGYKMPNFDIHNGESSKKRALTAKRVANHSAKTNAKPNASSVSDALAREEKIREEVNLNPLSGSANPDHVEPEVKRPDHLGSAKRVLEFLNLRTGKNYRPVASNLSMIVARLKEGYTEQEMRTVTMRKVNEWGTDEKMSDFLRPKTLYNATNFNSYAGILT